MENGCGISIIELLFYLSRGVPKIILPVQSEFQKVSQFQRLLKLPSSPAGTPPQAHFQKTLSDNYLVLADLIIRRFFGNDDIVRVAFD